MSRFIWTDEAVAFLRLYGGELSTRDVAAVLGTTRNAVIGKARRCRIMLRDQPAAAHCDEANALRRASLRANWAAKRAKRAVIPADAR